MTGEGWRVRLPIGRWPAPIPGRSAGGAQGKGIQGQTQHGWGFGFHGQRERLEMRETPRGTARPLRGSPRRCYAFVNRGWLMRRVIQLVGAVGVAAVLAPAEVRAQAPVNYRYEWTLNEKDYFDDPAYYVFY